VVGGSLSGVDPAPPVVGLSLGGVELVDISIFGGVTLNQSLVQSDGRGDSWYE
jgi:hypothetical protein